MLSSSRFLSLLAFILAIDFDDVPRPLAAGGKIDDGSHVVLIDVVGNVFAAIASVIYLIVIYGFNILLKEIKRLIVGIENIMRGDVCIVDCVADDDIFLAHSRRNLPFFAFVNFIIYGCLLVL